MTELRFATDSVAALGRPVTGGPFETAVCGPGQVRVDHRSLQRERGYGRSIVVTLVDRFAWTETGARSLSVAGKHAIRILIRPRRLPVGARGRRLALQLERGFPPRSGILSDGCTRMPCTPGPAWAFASCGVHLPLAEQSCIPAPGPPGPSSRTCRTGLQAAFRNLACWFRSIADALGPVWGEITGLVLVRSGGKIAAWTRLAYFHGKVVLPEVWTSGGVDGAFGWPSREGEEPMIRLFTSLGSPSAVYKAPRKLLATAPAVIRRMSAASWSPTQVEKIV